jgi:gamma-F420-2:alpha-L-glutamate ligase
MDSSLLEKFVFKGVKGKERPLTVVILTTKLGKSLKNAPSTDKIMKICEERGVRCIIIDTEKGAIQKTNKGTYLISSRGGKQQEIYLDRTIVLTRRSSIKNNAAKGFFKKMEDLGFPCVNSYDSVIICEDKLQTTRKLQLAKIPVPRTALISSEADIDKAVEEVGGEYPVVCKFLSGTKGIGVFMIDSRPSLVSTLQALWYLAPGTEIVLQEKIDADYDLRIHVVAESDGMAGREYKVIAAMKRIKIKGDFRTNFSLGGDTEKVKLSKEIEKIAIESAKATGCLWCGVDIIVEKTKNGDGEEKPYVLEVNASPGTTGIEKTTDIPVTDMIVDFLLDKKNWVKPKKVTGFREMITISGIGTFVGKLDTGNGATSCSLHADSIEEVDGSVHWKLGNQEFINKIVGQSKAEVGEKIHHRAVVNLDVDFNGVVYKKVKFSLVDRTEKSTPLLLNRDFLSAAGLVVDPSEDFVLTDRPEGYSPKDAKGDPIAGVNVMKSNGNSEK